MQKFSLIMKTKRPVVRPKPKWGNNIKMYLKGIMWVMGWIRLAEVRDTKWAFVKTVMNLRFTYKAENFSVS